MRILACVDASAYAPAVCDYAAWLTGPLDQHVNLLHAIEAGSSAAAANAVLSDAAGRLRDSGLEDIRRVAERGPFLKVAAGVAASCSMLVVGKRGQHGDGDRRLLGSNIEPLLRAVGTPTCLVSSLFLPVHRCLVLLDSDIAHRRTVEFLAAHPGLAALDTDVLVITEDGAGEEKLAWARERLGASGAEIYPISADGPHDAVERYRQEHPIDLLVISREVALAGDAAPLHRIEANSLWAWRAPVLIC